MADSKLTVKDFAAKATDKISMDCGNGGYKLAFVNKDGIQTDSCLTMVAKSIDYKSISNKKTYNVGGIEYVLGKDAEGTDSIANKSFDFHENYAKIFAYKFLEDNGLLKNTHNKTLLLGLSLPDYTPENVLAIIKALKTFVVNGKTISFKHVLVTVQGIGALKQYIATEKVDMPKRAFVVDIGTYTVIPLSYVNNEIVPTNAIYNDSGMVWLFSKLQEFITNKYPNCEISIPEVNLLWQESLSLRDKDIAAGIEFFNEEALFKSKESSFMNKLFFFEQYRPDVSAFLYRLEKEYVFDHLLRSVFANHKSEIGASELVLIVGGTNHLLKYYQFDTLKPNFKFCNEPYEYANVIGYLYHNYLEINAVNMVGIYKTQLSDLDINTFKFPKAK